MNKRYHSAHCPECNWVYIGSENEDEAIDQALRHYHQEGRPHQATVTPLTDP